MRRLLDCTCLASFSVLCAALAALGGCSDDRGHTGTGGGGGDGADQLGGASPGPLPMADAEVDGLAGDAAAPLSTPVMPLQPIVPTSGAIGSAGGSVRTAGGEVVVDVPPGAIDGELTITIEMVGDAPAGALGAAFALGPDATQFNEKVRIDFDYRALQITQDPSTLRVATAVDGAWQALPGSRLGIVPGKVSARTDHFSVFALIEGSGVEGPTGGTGGSVSVPAPTPANVEPTGDYIWVADTYDGTLSKIDTGSMAEVARYRTSPTGRGLPSRVSVAADGSVAVANRGGSDALVGSDGASVTRILSANDCIDRDQSGTIETSSGATDLLPWGTDECVAWHTGINVYSLRALAWAPPPAPDAPAKLWAAGATSCSESACTITVVRIDGTTGTPETTRDITLPAGTSIAVAGALGLMANYGPIAGVSDAGGNLWLFVANTTHLVRIDAVTLADRAWPSPSANGYGMTIDSRGRIFLCGPRGLSRFDVDTATWTESLDLLDLGLSGCTSDGLGTIWTAGGTDVGESGLRAFDADTLQLLSAHQIADLGSVAVDRGGLVWGLASVSAFAAPTAASTDLYRLVPSDGSFERVTGIRGARTFGDMTGMLLQVAGYMEPPAP